MKKILLRLLKAVTAIAGARVVDQRTGKVAGKAFFVPWRGKIRVIGFTGPGVMPCFENQQRLTYWNQALVFHSHPEPDYPREPKTDHSAHPPA